MVFVCRYSCPVKFFVKDSIAYLTGVSDNRKMPNPSAFSACPVGPEDRTGVAPEDGTGACPVAPEDGTGVP